MKRLVKAVVVLAVLALAGWYAYVRLTDRGAQEEQRQQASYTAVRRGPLVIDLIESGSIKPRKQYVIKSQVEGRVSITYIFPEGERVKKGERLLELDSSSFVDKLANQEISAKNADANRVQASENLAVTKNQAAADIAKAELDLRFAKEDLVKYEKGEYPKTLNEAETKVTLAREELKRAKDKLEWSARLYKEKYLSESDYRTDELSCKRYELELKSAENALNLLKDYTYKRQMAQLQSDVEQAEMALERIRRKANADITQATATLNARELELRRQNEQVEKLREQISNCRVLAPADGLVIYATSSQGPFRRQNQEPLDVGTEVYQRQDIIYLPEGDDFKAEIKVHETNLKKIYLGLPVRITVDALKGVEFSGHITKVAPLPDAQSLFMNPDLKLYNAEVAIDDARGMLKSGMNCRADIIVEQHADIAYVPIQCVVREGGKPVVYRRAATPGGADEAVPVEIGLDNNQVVIVRSGLEAGQEVSLTPPLDKADKPETRAAADPKLKIPPRPAEGEGGAPQGGGQPRFRGPRPNGGGMRRPGGGEGQGERPRGPRPDAQGGAQPQRQ
ncbi:MAG: efflux RND transporter periplasmic adaptor subunit [Oligosphaeraceae bacterium]